MPSKRESIVALVSERGPIGDFAIYSHKYNGKKLMVSVNEIRRAIADDGGMMKEDGADVFFLIPSSDESRADLEEQGFAPIKIRGR